MRGHRVKLSKRTSRKIFKRTSRTKRKNVIRNLSRGGIQL